MKNSKAISIFTVLALLICAATIIPFGQEVLIELEWLIKFCVFPVVILLISIIATFSRKKYIGNNQIGVIGALFPVTAFISSLFFFMATLTLKNHDFTIMKEFYSIPEWITTIVFFASLGLVFLLASFYLLFAKFNDKSKCSFIASTILIHLCLIGQAVLCFVIDVKELVNVSHDVDKIFMFSCIGSGVIFLLYLIVYFSEVKSIVKPITSPFDPEIYNDIETDYLLAMYSFAKENLETRGYKFETAVLEAVEEQPVEEVVEEQPVEEVVEEQPVEEVVEEQPVEEVVEEQPVEEVVEEQPVEEVQEAKVEEEVVIDSATVLPIKKEPKPRVKKEILPAVSELVKFIEDNFDDVTIVYGKDNENFKVYRKKKIMLIVQTTFNDYRIIFQRKPISVAKMIIKYPNAIMKSTSPKGDQWFKATNKGDISEEDLKAMIKYSHKYMVDEEEKALAKKEKEKAKAKAKAQAIKDKEKAKIQAEKDKEKAKIQAEKDKEKAIADKEKAKIQAEKDKEKAKALAEKEKAKAQAEKEKEKEKAKALAEKEKAKAQAEKEKEKEKAKALAEKAKAKAQAEKEKEKEKAKVLAEKEKAKALAEKEKEKEKAKVLAEKEKAKAKAQAEKEKEKEKAKALAEKEKAKAKAQAEKEKEKEKAKALAEKEKAKAKAQAEKEKEKEKAKALAEKEKAKAKAQAEKEKAKAKAQAEKEKEKEKAKALAEKEKAKALAEKEKAKEEQATNNDEVDESVLAFAAAEVAEDSNISEEIAKISQSE